MPEAFEPIALTAETERIRIVAAAVTEIFSSVPLEAITDDTLRTCAEMMGEVELRASEMQRSIVEVVATRRWERARQKLDWTFEEMVAQGEMGAEELQRFLDSFTPPTESGDNGE